MKEWQEKIKRRADFLKTEIPALFLAMKSADTPLLAKALGWFGIAYALSPIDLIPDFIPILGYADDLILIPAIIAAAIKLIPKETMERCRIEALDMRVLDAPKAKLCFAAVVIALWAMIAKIIIKCIVKGVAK